LKRVIITAANSFIGRRVTKVLSENGYYVYAVVRNTFTDHDIFKEMVNCKIIHCDMNEYDALGKCIAERCDIGIAMAWDGTRGIDRSDKEKQENNFKNSADAINSFIALGCSKIITAGSQAEYGSCFGKRKITEEDICRPNTAYGVSKLKLFEYAERRCAENRIVLIEPRYFSLYGEDDYAGTMIISIIQKMLNHKPCELTECIQQWDFLYIDDAVNALYKLLVSETAEGIYNIGSGISKPLREYIEEMRRISDSRSELLYGTIPYPETGIVNTNPAIDKLLNTIGWKPETSFEEGICKVIRYQKGIVL